jgi:YQGE family putative transporter
MSNKIDDKRALRILFWSIFVRAWRIVFQIFLNIFIWKNTWDIKQVALFNIIYLTSHFTSFVLFSPIVKMWYRRFLHIFSLVWFAFVYLYIVFLWENAINHLFIIPLLIGLFNWIYWINFHNNQFDLTTFKNRWNFEWIKKSLMIVSQILVPGLIWFIITLNYMWYGYEIAYSVWILFFILSIVIWTVWIEVKNDEKYDLFQVFKKVIKDKDVFRSLYTYSLTWFSFGSSLLEVLIPIILFTYVKEEASVWFLISWFSIVTIIWTYLFGRFIPYDKYSKIIIIIWTLYVLSILWFITFSELKYLVIFWAILNMFTTIFSLPQKVYSDNVLHKIKNYKKIRSEYMVIREIFLFIGWISSFTIMYFIWSIEIKHLYYLFVVVIIAISLATYSLSKVRIEEDIQ